MLARIACGGTFVCASDQHCRAPCLSRTDCTSEQVCVSGVCAAAAELDPNNQLPQVGSGSAADGGTNACQVGPGGYCWSTYTDPGATATWVTPPTTSSVHLSAQSASDGGAAMIATLGSGTVIDLSQYDQMWFDADIPVGTMFSVGIGKAIAPSDSCSWDLTGAGSTRYTVDLRAAKYCNQTACGFDRSQVRSISWGTGGFGTDFRLDMTLTALGFSRVYSVSQPLTTADGASLGLNGWCWSLFSWGAASGIGATASWVTPPTANHVEVSLTDTSITSQSGVAVELPLNLQDLTAASYIDIDASVLVAGATSFEVALLDMNDAYWMYTVGAVAGAHTYSIPIGYPTSRGTARGHAFNSQAVRLLRVETLWSAQETADITVTRIAIRGAGAGSKDAGAKDVAADIPVIVPDAGAKDLAADLPVGTPDSRTTAALDGGTAILSPLCPNLKIAPDGGAAACSPSDSQLCSETCGPRSLGQRTETCACGAYVPGDCQFPAGDYSCFKIPNVTPSECPTVAPQDGQPCAIADCIVCGEDTGFFGSSGAPERGYCVCDATTRSWTCGHGGWPCPGGTGCDVSSGGAPSACLAPLGHWYTQGNYSGYLWTWADGTSTIYPPCGSGVCFGDTIAVSGVVRKVPFVGCGYDYQSIWGVNLGWSLNTVNLTELPADVSGKQSVTIGLSGATELPLRVVMFVPNPDGGADTEYCAPLGLPNGVRTIALTDLSIDCWQLGGKRFDPAAMKPTKLAILVYSLTSQDTPFNFCLTQLKIE